jgi:uncharacterized membrane protein
MEEALIQTARYVGLALSALAILAVVIGAIEAVIGIARGLLAGWTDHDDRQTVWLGFARWLVSGLTFQLAADIVQTTAAPTWDEIGRVAAIAGIRTFLTYFLDRDIEAMSRRAAEGAAGAKSVRRA